MFSKKFMGKVAAFTVTLTMICPMAANATSAKSGVFKDTIPVAQKKAWTGKKYEAKPLIILMDFKDYKHDEIFEKEDWNINGYKKEQKTDYLYSPQFYRDRFFGEERYTGSDGNSYVSIRKFLNEESGGSYIFNGDVAGWYTAEHDAAYYGSTQDDANKLVIEALKKVANDPNIDLSKYDVEDKWDYDNDGNYYEPDGIIDSLVVIHPGIGEEHGGGHLGKDAIWPYRARVSWYPSSGYKMPEVTDSKGKKWKGEDYTVFAQDLPMDLFGHEYGHVLGLFDLYGFGDSTPPVDYWSLMGGSYTGPIRGTMPNSYGAYGREYLQKDFESKGFKLNWQNAEEFSINDLSEKGKDIVIGQSSVKDDKINTIRIDLPEKETTITKMKQGNFAYFTDNKDDSRTSMSTLLDLTSQKSAKLKFSTWYDIDPEYDYLSVQVSEQGKNKWEAIKGNITTDKNPNDETPDDPTDRNPGHGITGDSGKAWVDAEFDLSKYAGKKIDLKFFFWTDGNTPQEGAYIDEIKVLGDNDKVLLEDNAEGEDKFKLDGFKKSNAVKKSDHNYLIEWRNHKNGEIDEGLGTFPSNRMKGITYDPGLVMWYMNRGMLNGSNRANQQTDEHPGSAYASVVDADQEPVRWIKGDQSGIDGVDYQLHDAAFGLKETTPIEKKWENGAITRDNNTFMNPYFHDKNSYFNGSDHTLAQSGVILNNYGLRVFVTDQSKNSSSAKLHISTDTTKNITKQDASMIQRIKVKNNELIVQTDDLYGEKAYVSLLVEQKGKTETKKIKLARTNKEYKAKLDFKPNGTEKINFIILEDKEGNTKSIYNLDVHKIFGAKLAINSNPVKGSFKNNKNKFKLNAEEEVKANVKNNSDNEELASLYVAVYNEKNKLVKYEKSGDVVLKPQEDKELSVKIKLDLPKDKKYKVKAFLWNGEKNKMPIEKAITFDVEQ